MAKQFRDAHRKMVLDTARAGLPTQPLRDGDRYLDRMPKVWPWHAARAEGCERVFQRVEHCGEQWQAVGRCTSEACQAARASVNAETGVQRIPLGCSSRFFCDECKKRIAQDFRKEFNAGRLGVIWGASLQGRMNRWRPKYGREARFGERLVTLTEPHVGEPEERVRWLFDAWPLFLRKWNGYIREQLGTPDAPDEARCTVGKKRGDGETTVFPVNRDGEIVEVVSDLCHEVRIHEWTPGGDGAGHPHFHVWAFGIYMPHELIRLWWAHAWEEASGKRLERDADGRPVIMIDVRQVIGDQVEVRDSDGNPVLGKDGNPIRAHIANELIKYLTKDWGAEPEVFSRIFGELFQRRARQTSRGFARFAVPIVRLCEDCGAVHESTRGFSWMIEPAPGSIFATPIQAARGPPPVLPDDTRVDRFSFDYMASLSERECRGVLAALVTELAEERWRRRSVDEQRAIIERLIATEGPAEERPRPGSCAERVDTFRRRSRGGGRATERTVSAAERLEFFRGLRGGVDKVITRATVEVPEPRKDASQWSQVQIELGDE